LASRRYLFEDPDGIRLELCFVPGTGLLASGESFDPVDGYGEARS
jgi:hypothetical protein